VYVQVVMCTVTYSTSIWPVKVDGNRIKHFELNNNAIYCSIVFADRIESTRFIKFIT
jgi:hypothetical protein